MKRSMKLRGRGFTLIELMVAVSIVAILAAVALPAYFQYVERARRTDAKNALLTAAQTMERLYTQNNSYAAATIGDAAGDTIPDHAPADRPHAERTYDISFGTPSTLTANAYTLTATRAGVQANDTTCGDFTLTSAGAKGVTLGTVARCW